MALVIACGNPDVMHIDEYIEYIQTHVDTSDLESLVSSAPMLRALANDRVLVVKELNNLISNPIPSLRWTTVQSILLGQGNGFYVRANIWPAHADMANARAYQNQIAYNIAHDHNFTFLTVTHLGPGYETDLYEYDYDRVTGHVGERVDLQFQQKAKFTPGNVMLYRASRDAHVQFPPEELTITLNLMVSGPELARDQYQFDLKTGTISAVGDPRGAGRLSLVKLAGLIGDGDSDELLADIAKNHPCRQTRLAAYESLAKRQPVNKARIWERASEDSAEVVTKTALKKLQDFGNV